MPATKPAERLTDLEIDMWRTVLRAHSAATRRLEAELLAECGLPLGWYDVLLHLAEAPGRRLRMTDLADRVLLSPSGLTRLVDRLVDAGLIERASCPSDARGTFAALTAAGLERLRQAAPVHLRGVREHVTGRLSPAEQRQVREILGKVAGPAY